MEDNKQYILKSYKIRLAPATVIMLVKSKI